MTIAPALFLSLFSAGVNLIFLVEGLIDADISVLVMRETMNAIIFSVINSYAVLFIIGSITTATEWNNINSTTGKKIKYIFTFPIFIFTYMPYQ